MAEEIKSELVVVDAVHDPEGGHITIRVRWRNTRGKATWFGPEKGYGVDATAFNKRFNGDIQQVLNWIASEHQQYKGADPEVTKKMTALKGKVIG
jgi:hypothetical protein